MVSNNALSSDGRQRLPRLETLDRAGISRGPRPPLARRLAPLWYGLLAFGGTIAASVDAAPAEADGQDRVVRAAGGYAHEREPGTLREIGSLPESRTAPADVVTKARGATGRISRTASEYVVDHWIYDAAAEMYYDADGDGYYRYLRIRFDVDSYYDNAWIFARLYLSDDGEHWEMFYETDDFRVDGAWPDDEYEVETELVVSYPPGLYDVLIEIYDADTLEFQDEFGPAQSSAFALLPLEDASYDGVTPPVVVVSEGGGGGVSIGALLLLALGAAAARRARARRLLSIGLGRGHFYVEGARARFCPDEPSAAVARRPRRPASITRTD